ncbi:unnamed protein product [Bemisia tabaci]|uniref:Nbr1 FW domain-containing protein n=1 Tax=Bemisia tabaci TaxID=7038 RepID=A0A9P0A8Q7_BEMTA|nr:PREDICTED: uncharacterized protein C6orf106 homolog [Bemisia tabaci]CAH0388996.1 unnamed protein product [Bemisia tabaci]
MDVDNDLVDQNLLQQFSCMGTTDKDDLIKQLQCIVGNINEPMATFFLEMNNWNLQAAIGSYYDSDNPVKLPSMSVIRDEMDAETFRMRVPPKFRFLKVWKLLNSGDETWPIGCCLQFTSRDKLTQEDRIPVEPLAPGAIADIGVIIVAPDTPGTYQSKCRMVATNGAYFGDVIWFILDVEEDADKKMMSLAQQLSHMNQLGSTLPQTTDPNRLTNPFEAIHSNSSSNSNSSHSHLPYQDSVPNSIPDNDRRMC